MICHCWYNKMFNLHQLYGNYNNIINFYCYITAWGNILLLSDVKVYIFVVYHLSYSTQWNCVKQFLNGHVFIVLVSDKRTNRVIEFLMKISRDLIVLLISIYTVWFGAGSLCSEILSWSHRNIKAYRKKETKMFIKKKKKRF